MRQKGHKSFKCIYAEKLKNEKIEFENKKSKSPQKTIISNVFQCSDKMNLPGKWKTKNPEYKNVNVCPNYVSTKFMRFPEKTLKHL